MKLVPIDIDKLFDPNRVISNAEIMDKDRQFTDNGVYSEKIFGSLNGDDLEYACKCGKIHGRITEGMLCTDCNTRVYAKQAIISRMGWIDLGDHKVINPRFMGFIQSYIGSSRLKRYLYDRIEIDVDGNVKLTEEDPNKKVKDPLPECVGMGVTDFIANFDSILEVYHGIRKEEKQEIYYFLRKYRNLLFISKIPVYSPRLRPVVIIGDKVISDQVNQFYQQIIKLVAGLKSLGRDRTPLSEIPYVNKIQEILEEVDNSVILALNGKKGLIRNTVLGSRLNFSTRCVITPLPVGTEVDEIHIPYVVGLELFKLEILNYFRTKYSISYFDAMVRFAKSINTFDEDVYNFLNDRIGEEGRPVLLNRNPTISIGSILRMRITHIKRDTTDKTMSIRNNVLKFLNGDYDGDVLNLFLILMDKYDQSFKKLSPQNLLFSFDDGKFNSNLGFSKDYLLGLQTLIM